MKKIVGIMLVLVMVLAFAVPALAEPVDLENGSSFDIYVPDPDNPDVAIPADETNLDVFYEELTPEADEALTSIAEGVVEADEDVDEPDEIKPVVGVEAGLGTYDENGEMVGWETYTGGGYFTFWDDSINSYDLVQIMQTWEDEDGGWYNMYDAAYDESDGSWNIWVDDIGYFSYYVALIQRGVAPEEAAELAQEQAQKSPKTADNGAGEGLLLIIMALGIAGAAVSIKKVAGMAK
ncbi:hypothetical protein [Christensenella intestinihominis]|uniref:hypothetical protein n=1 Tax=Christensenella intestinihominis TaxID=1851429 RepID=UPI000836742F|nr:hypothetical protein [Christensenella intestinihominis]